MARATSSGLAMASVLGRISANTTTSTVMMPVAISGPITEPSGNIELSTEVVSDEAKMLMTL